MHYYGKDENCWETGWQYVICWVLNYAGIVAKSYKIWIVLELLISDMCVDYRYVEYLCNVGLKGNVDNL